MVWPLRHHLELHHQSLWRPIDPTRGSRSYIHPGAVLEIWRAEFEVALEERTLFLLTMHPQVIGHRSRLRMLETLVEEIRATPGVWFATHEAVARFVRAEAAERGRLGR